MSNREQLYTYKGNRCASCGLEVEDMIERYGTFDRMFEFHHVVPSTKDRDYKRLMAQRLSRRQMDELDKCVLLCTQCHRIIHAQNNTGTLELAVEVGRRRVTQRVHGWIRTDRVAKQVSFVTNEPYLLEPCEVRAGQEAPRLMFLVEIERSDNLQRWLAQLEQHRNVEIVSLRDRKRFMRIEHIEGDQFTVTQAIGFPVTSFEFVPRDVPDEVVFFRNGVVLTKKGNVHTSGQVTYTATRSPSAPSKSK